MAERDPVFYHMIDGKLTPCVPVGSSIDVCWYCHKELRDDHEPYCVYANGIGNVPVEGDIIAVLGDALRVLTCVTFDEGIGGLDELEEARPEMTGVDDWHAGDLYERELLRLREIGQSGEQMAILTKDGEELVKYALGIAVQLTRPGVVLDPSPSKLLFHALGKEGCQILADAVHCEADPDALEPIAAIVREATEWI